MTDEVLPPQPATNASYGERDWPDATDARFWAKVDRVDGACWEWTAGKTSAGYGIFQARGFSPIPVYAHRRVYELLVGPIPDGLQLDHLCRNRWCVNPAHLEPVTHVENVKRGIGGQNMRDKTHCPAGHAYSASNILRTRKGGRDCRACHNRRSNERYHRLKAARSCPTVS